MNWKSLCISLFYRHEKTICTLFLVLALSMVFLAMYTYPYISDDYIYMNQIGGENLLKNFNDIYLFQINHYFNWGGRTVAHTILQLLFLSGNSLGSIMNMATFALVSMLISKIASIENKTRIYTVLFVIGCLMFLNPEYEETILWRTGSANYLWTTAIVLVSIYPITLVYKNIELKRYHYLLVAFSFFAGWCNENISIIVVLFTLYSIYHMKKRKNKIYKFMICEFVLSVIGGGLLILAPGNYIRSDTLPTGIMSILYRGHGQVNAWLNWLLPVILLLVLCLLLMKSKREKLGDLHKILLLAGLLSILVMIASPSYPSRATFGSLVILLIPLVGMIELLLKNNQFIYKVLALVMVAGFIGTNMSMSILHIVRDFGAVIPG